MADEARSLDAINDRAVRILVREMGPTDTARFIGQFTEDPANTPFAVLDDLTLDNVASPIHDGRERR